MLLSWLEISPILSEVSSIRVLVESKLFVISVPFSSKLRVIVLPFSSIESAKKLPCASNALLSRSKLLVSSDVTPAPISPIKPSVMLNASRIDCRLSAASSESPKIPVN